MTTLSLKNNYYKTMAHWENLKSAVSGAIKENGEGAITGQLLQSTLNSIITNIGKYATFAGIATTKTRPGIIEGPVFYLANEVGTYSNFQLHDGTYPVIERENTLIIITNLSSFDTSQWFYGVISKGENVNVIDSGASDLDIADEKGNILVSFINGHIKTQNFNSEDENIKVADSEASDLDIADEEGNILASFSNGHIKTQNFNSEEGNGNVSIIDSGASDLDIADEEGNILASFSNGHIKTQNFNSEDASGDTTSASSPLKFLSYVTACTYSGNLMHISFDDTSTSISALFSGSYSSIYNVQFFADLKSLHETYGACFSLYVYAEKLANVSDKFKAEFQSAKTWLKWNFHALNDKKYDSSTNIASDYDLGINRLLTMVGHDIECLDHQMRANYWTLSLNNAKYVRDNEIHSSYIFCAKDPFSPSSGNYYLNDWQKQFVYNNGKFFDLDNRVIFIQTCARLDSDEYCLNSKKLIAANIKWQKNCEVLNHEWGFNKARMSNFLKWARDEMNFKFGFFDDIYKLNF